MPRRGLRTYPAHGPRDGRGARIDDASGFLRPADDVVKDRRQGLTSKDFADLTPGFGTYHPQDVRRPPAVSDPKPIRQARPDPNPGFLGPKELGYTDAEIREAIRQNRPLTPKV
jgi:hypothetical protein